MILGSAIIQLLFILFTTLLIKQTQCAGGVEESVPLELEVHGVTIARLDQLFTQLLFGADEEAESAFDQLHCRISTFLLVHEITEIRENENRKFKNWLEQARTMLRRKKGKPPKNRRDKNLLEFFTRIEAFDNEMRFDGLDCQNERILPLSELYCMLYQVKKRHTTDIGQLLIGRDTEVGETEKQYMQRLSENRGQMYYNAMRAFLAKGRQLWDRINECKKDDERMLSMKVRLRRVIDDQWMFKNLEMRTPLFFRIDLIEKPRLSSLYQRVLSIRVDNIDECKNSLSQLHIPWAVAIILKGKRENTPFMDEFREYWEQKVGHLSSYLTGVYSLLIEFWRLHTSNGGDQTLAEFDALINEENYKSLMELLQTDKLGEEFKQFLDQTRGAKARLINMLDYGMDAHLFVLENPELAKLIVRDYTDCEEEICAEFQSAYIQWFSGKAIDSEKGHLAADVLFLVLDLSIKYDTQEARKKWAPYRAMFLIFVDQLEDAKPEFVQSFGLLYKNMLRRLWDLKDRVPEKFEVMLEKEIRVLKGLIDAGNKGELSETKINLEGEDDEDWLDEHHRKVITLFRGKKFEESLNEKLGPAGKKRMDAFMKGKSTNNSNSKLGNSDKKIVNSSSSPSVSPVSVSPVSTMKSSYFECPKQRKTQDKSDKGFDQLKPYESYLTKNAIAPNREHWKKMINLNTAIWHYQNTILDIFKKIKNKFPIEKQIIGELSREFSELLKWEATETEVKARNSELEQKMCKFLVFIFRLRDFLLHKSIESSGKFKAETDELLGEIESQLPNNDLANVSSKLQCDINNSPEISKNMMQKLDIYQQNFNRLDRMLNQYEAFKHFFCDQPSTVKDGLIGLLGPNLLEQLERRHPEALKIYDFRDDVRLYLYEQILMNRKGSNEATNAEHRHFFRMILKSDLQWIEEREATEFLNDQIHQIVQEKTNWLKQEIFHAHPTTTNSFLKNICLVNYFNYMVQHYGMNKFNEKSDMDVAESVIKIRSWNGKECDDMRKVEMAFSMQRNLKERINEHLSFFHGPMESKISQLMKFRGYMTWFSQLTPDPGINFDPNLLVNHEIVRELIERALLEVGEEKLEMARLGLGYAIWSHRMDAELAKIRDEPLGQKILRELWNEQERRQKILDKFNAIFDEQLSDLQGQFGLHLVRMQAGLLNMIKKWRQPTVFSKGKMLEKMREEFDNAVSPSDRVIQMWKSAKEKKDLEQLLQSANRQEMLAQLTQHPEWRMELKQKLDGNKKARLRLPMLFGRERIGMDAILKAIPLEIEVADELDLIEDNKNNTDAIKVDNKLIETEEKREGKTVDMDTINPMISKITGVERSAGKKNSLAFPETKKGSKTLPKLSKSSVSNKRVSKNQRDKAKKNQISGEISLDMRSLTPQGSEGITSEESEDFGLKASIKLSSDEGEASTTETVSSDNASSNVKGLMTAAPFESLTQSADAKMPPAIEEGEWKLQKIKRNQIKPGKHELYNGVGSSIPKGQRNLHETKAYGWETEQHKPGTNLLLNYMAVAKKSTGAKKGKAGEETELLATRKADLSKSRPIGQMASMKDGEKATAIVSEKQRNAWATLREPAESQAAAALKLTEPLRSSGAKASEMKATEEKGVNSSQLMLGSLSFKNLQALSQKAVEQREQQPKAYKTSRNIQKGSNSIESKSQSGQMQSHNKRAAEIVSEKPVEKAKVQEKGIEEKQAVADEPPVQSPMREVTLKASEYKPALTIQTKVSTKAKAKDKQIEVPKTHVEFQSLRELLEKKGQLTTDPTLTQQAVENLTRIVHSWSSWTNNVHWLQIEFGIRIKEAILLFTGSYLIDLHTADSDIDCIVLLPYIGSSDRDWELLYKRFFFGDELGSDNQEVEVICDLVSRHCTNWSLYCMLCVDTIGVTTLIKLRGRDQIPMITVKLHGFDFDLLFVTVPMQRMVFVDWSLPTHLLKSYLTSLPFVDQMIASFIDWIDLSKNENRNDIYLEQGQSQIVVSLPKKDSRKGMLLALSGYRANLLIRNLIANNNVFKMAYLALKLWAKNNFVYGGKFGLLNGTTLTILILQVFLKHSNDSVPNLLFQFFNTYSTWNWPDPVKLDEALSQRAINNNHYYSSLDWHGPKEEEYRREHFWLYSGYYYLEEHAKLMCPVIVPGFPTQNSAFNFNGWTKQAMEREFEYGLEQMKSIQETIKDEKPPQWTLWIEGKPFHEKYDHFVVIFYAAQSADQLRTFCDYVESRIRLQLLFTFGDPKSQVKWMHANPERVRNGSRCPPGEEVHLIPAGNNWLCTIWLVGVQMVEGTKKEEVRKILEQKLEKFDSVGWNEAPRREERSRLEDFPHKIIKSLIFKRQGSFTSSPRGSAESSRGSPSSNNENSPRTPSPSHISSTAVVIEEKLWTKYFVKEQLQEWLQIIA